jgi:hypothetical protein
MVRPLVDYKAVVNSQKAHVGKGTVTESTTDQLNEDQYFGDPILTDELATHRRKVVDFRMRAKEDTVNYAMIKRALMNKVEKYDISRIDYERFKGLNLVELPGKEYQNHNQQYNAHTRGNALRKLASVAYKYTIGVVVDKIKQFIQADQYRADFVIGFSIHEKINFEIWYVTEVNRNYRMGSGDPKVFSSFYVFDVSSAKIIRKYIPYYRNAEQVLIQKLLPV